MDHEVIASWLGVPAKPWPPDHYTILGLSPGESDEALIEEQAQARLLTIRHYQLTHPEAATEAMTRLAQAFVCLTDSEQKAAYDQQLLGIRVPSSSSTSKETSPPVEAPPEEEAKEESEEAESITSEAAAWLKRALKSLQTGGSLPDLTSIPSSQVVVPEDLEATQAQNVQSPLAQTEAPRNEDELTGQSSRQKARMLESVRGPRARKSMATLRVFYEQIVDTRKTLALWEQAGKYLGREDKKVSSPAEAKELISQLTQIRKLLADFPLTLGEAGQPGYLVMSLARQPEIVPTFQQLQPEHREALKRDWEVGQEVLEAHKESLRAELRARRKRSWLGRHLRDVHNFMRAYPATWLAVGGVAALIIVLIRQLI